MCPFSPSCGVVCDNCRDYPSPLFQVTSRPPTKREAVSPPPSYDLDDGHDMEWVEADEDGPVKQKEADDCTSVTCEGVTGEGVKEEDIEMIEEEKHVKRPAV